MHYYHHIASITIFYFLSNIFKGNSRQNDRHSKDNNNINEILLGET